MIVRADMASIVWRITVGEGERVRAGQELLILESMKMEMPVLAPVAGMVADIPVAEGDVIEAGDELVRIERSR
ncbi:MAG: biotin/lipoyl-binding carrier protein [bacterium]|nr:biotin/lipoyl-binding carrier protein [bacterium]MDE0352431.1 biotin/lipoyl-binding carrier protein [bacterium]